MSGETYQIYGQSLGLTTIHCGSCGGFYAIDEHVRKTHNEQGTCWNCPYCETSWGYSTSDADRLREKLEAEKNAKKRVEWALQETKNSLRGQKAATTRARNRAKNGVCPCCHRNFRQLRLHMKNKHPDFKPEETP